MTDNDQNQTDLEPPAWRPGHIWFREWLPAACPWGREDLLDPVPATAQGKLGIVLAEPAEIDGVRHGTGEIIEASGEAEFMRLVARFAGHSAFFFPWYDRLVPGTLLIPYARPPDPAGYRSGMIRRFLRALAVAIGLGFIAYSFEGLRLFGLVLATMYGLHPMIGALIGIFEGTRRRTVAEWNRGLVNEVFFNRWIEAGKSRLLAAGMVVLVLLFLGQSGVGTRASIEAAALVKEKVRTEGEWWRLITAGLMHGSLIHILFNGMALASVGKFITRLVHPPLLAFVFLTSVVTGSLASLHFGQAGASVGASGGILGCFGFLFMLTGKFQEELPAFLRASLLQSIIVVAIFGWLGSGFIDNAAHGGGFAGGVVLASLMDRHLRLGGGDPGPLLRWISRLSIVVLALAAVKVAWALWTLSAAGR